MNMRTVLAVANKERLSTLAEGRLWKFVVLSPSVWSACFSFLFLSPIFRMIPESKTLDDWQLQLLELLPSAFSPFALSGSREFFFEFICSHLLILILALPLLGQSASFAARSFAAEKERKTVEALLFSPIEAKALLIGKALWPAALSGCSSVSTFFSGWLSINFYAFARFGHFMPPPSVWFAVFFWTIPNACLMFALFNVWSEARFKPYSPSQIAAVLAGVALFFLFIFFICISTFFGNFAVLGLGALLLWANILILRSASRHCQRNLIFESSAL